MTAAESILAHRPMRALLAGAIDYAGLFPPASLDLTTVAANYAAYRRGADAWALGRLVVPASQLDALAEAAGPWWTAPQHEPWRISALIGADAMADAGRIRAFNTAHDAHAMVDSVESRAGTEDAVAALAGVFDGLEHFVEIPVCVDLPPLLRRLTAIGARAKIRTGGVTPEAIPAPRDVARFLRACVDANVPFKATAGLHHPLRGRYPLTYAPNAPTGLMYGYLNVLLAAAQARAGASVDALVTTLEERHHDRLGLDDVEVRWDGGRASADELAMLRRDFARSFGSCSFREPLDEIGVLHSY
jgi:hypothetical protein